MVQRVASRRTVMQHGAACCITLHRVATRPCLRRDVRCIRQVFLAEDEERITTAMACASAAMNSCIDYQELVHAGGRIQSALEKSHLVPPSFLLHDHPTLPSPLIHAR